MAKKFKVWIEIERIDDHGTDDESYTDEDCPISIAYRDTLEEAVELQESIEKTFSELNQ